MKKYILYLFIIAAAFVSGCNNNTGPAPEQSLENIYNFNSANGFTQYLDRWSAASKPLTRNEFYLLSDTLQAIYVLFYEFYDPFDLNKYCSDCPGPEFGNIYDNVHYLILQNEIHYSFGSYEQRKTLRPFNPYIRPAANIVYLTDSKKTELEEFLNRDLHMDLQQRYDFLNTQLKILSGHWFGWHFLTHPEIEIIYFSPMMRSATVHFRIAYQGGEANFVRAGGQWIMTGSKLTWIE